MSAKKAGVAGNAPGRYYVTEGCIGCTLCRETAPGQFRTDSEQGHDYVFRQPQRPEEEHLCAEVKKACPVDAIRDDGPEAGRPAASEVAKTPCGDMHEGFQASIPKRGAG